MTPNEVAIALRNIGSKWLRESIGKRMTVQIECPHIIGSIPADSDPTTEDEELGTDHGRGIIAMTIGQRTIDHNAGPLSRYWSAKL